MKRNPQLLKHITNEMNGIPLLNVPLIEMAADHRILIENHCGVTYYGETAIGIQVCFGNVRIEGRELEISYMSRQKLIITGCICKVELCRRKRNEATYSNK